MYVKQIWYFYYLKLNLLNHVNLFFEIKLTNNSKLLF